VVVTNTPKRSLGVAQTGVAAWRDGEVVVKALTICQPWAWLVIHGPKRWENRTWQTTYRGPLAIHAGGSRAWLEAAYANERLRGLLPPAGQLPFRAVIGVAELARIVPAAQAAGEPFAEGPLCWRLDAPRPLARPISMPGRPGLWELPPELDLWGPRDGKAP